jgi:CHAD domain-containing protein
MHFCAAAASILEPRLEKVFAHAAGVRAGTDSEEVHDMRVASRRLRTAMGIFAPCFPRRRFQELRADVASLTQALGLVRDTEVLLEAVEPFRAAAAVDEIPGLDDLLQSLQQQRANHRDSLLDVLDATDRRRVHHRLAVLLADSSSRTAKHKSAVSLAQKARQLSARRIADLYGLAPFLHDPARKTELHELRKAAKHLRYSLEIFESCFGPSCAARIDDMKAIQDHIGKIHDCDVLIDLVKARLTAHAYEDIELLCSRAIAPEPLSDRLRQVRTSLTSLAGDVRLGLLALLGQTHDERIQRYEAFVAWWDEHDAQGLRAGLYECLAAAAE